MVKGQFVSIDEGNRTERVLIGLGAGRTGVQASVQVYEITPEGMRNVESLQADAKSSYKPGMALMMGAGGLAGNLLTSAVVSGITADEATSDVDREDRGERNRLRRPSDTYRGVIADHHALDGTPHRCGPVVHRRLRGAHTREQDRNETEGSHHASHCRDDVHWAPLDLGPMAPVS